MERLYQFGLSSRKRFPLFPDAASQRRAVSRLARAAPGKIVAFGLFAHGHLGALEEEQRVGLLKRTFRSVLQPIAAQPIEPVWCEVIEGRNHLRSLLRYWLTQLEHHNLPGHPALWEGSCFLDLIGARRIPGLEPRCRELLPELRIADLCSFVGLPPGAVRPLDDARTREIGLARVALAATATLGVPSLECKAPAAMAGKRLVAQVARELDLPSAEARRILGVSAATARRLAAAPRDAELHRALRCRLAVEEGVLATALPARAGSEGSILRRNGR